MGAVRQSLTPEAEGLDNPLLTLVIGEDKQREPRASGCVFSQAESCVSVCVCGTVTDLYFCVCERVLVDICFLLCMWDLYVC